MIHADPRIEAFNDKFHAEKYGPDNKGESFEQQRQEEVVLLKMAYWTIDTSLLSQKAKETTLEALAMRAGYINASEALNGLLIQIYTILFPR